MTSRTRQPVRGDRDDTISDAEEVDASAAARQVLARYLSYVLPEVAAINPTSAMLLDQAISGLMQAPQSPDDPLVRTRYS